jgi:hypothetical protein
VNVGLGVVDDGKLQKMVNADRKARHVSDLTARFSALSPSGKAMFLARVAHAATVYAREAYAYAHQDGVLLRNNNEFVHRVIGYIMCVLTSSEGEGQDGSIMEMIAEYFRAHRVEEPLFGWLENSN